MDKFIKELKAHIIPVIWVFVLIATTGGALNYGGAFYVITSLINLGFGIYAIIKYAKEYSINKE